MEIQPAIAPVIQKPATARWFWLIVALAAVCALPLILPGDAPWINDEPQLLAAAYNADHTPGRFLGIPLPFTISSQGLPGNRGAVYGPAAEWFYQLLLLLPHNLVLLMAIRAGLVTLVTAAGLIWLSRVAGLSPRFAVVILLSPWLWFYSRQLWDNSFCIPLSVLAVGAYAGFLKTRSPWALGVALFCMALMPLIHLMALALVIPMALHMLLYQPRWLWRFKWVVVGIVAVVGVFAWPYAKIFISTYEQGVPPDSSAWQGWVYPLMGAHHLSALRLGDLLGSNWMGRGGKPLAYLVATATCVSGLAYLAVWVGMILAIPRAWRVFKTRPNCTVLDHVAAVAMGTFLCQTLLDGSHRVYGFAHYYNGTWIAYAVFAWLAVDALPRRGVALAALPVYAASLLVVLGYLLIQIHVDGGMRFDESIHSRGYGSTIANQQEVADMIGRSPAGSIHEVAIPQWTEYPVEYDTLHLLRPPLNIRSGPPRRLVIQYRNAFPNDSRIEVVDSPLPPRGATQPATVPSLHKAESAISSKF